jgi:hypothetical protein
MKTKKKICWNCEGNVAIDNEVCPYCGVHVNNTPIPGTGPQKNQDLAAPFKPTTTGSADKSPPKAPYMLPTQEDPVENKENTETPKISEEENLSDFLQESLLTLLALLIGGVLLIFGFILFFFSNSEGVFTLSWNGNYWFIYTLVSVPLLYIGWRSLSKIS